ncbi:nuclear transport factor 2 family protein [Lysobacter soli]|uniref:nuclear transport factor 2 family protein n=1 Tax=Lysobacter soli TaxID=453783 RepID=UPI0024101423|nr:nuclear transport factor 2 family protein [Lysobacter soli]MDG2517991.1 nuclear transport factor 2 family protein [Lysobacter soli]
MKKFMSAVAVLAAMAGPGAALAQDDQSRQAALTRKVAALDTAVFDAFNTCSKPVQLEKHASFFAPDVEFYHDAGGVTWSRREMIENTQRYVCGHFRRELVPGTLKVFPISNYGAIEQGTHRFCQLDTGKCDGIADFVIVWENRDGAWRITRVLSYGHRANG